MGTIQEVSYLDLIRGNDLGLQSNTGSGKTLSYLLPIVSKIMDAALGRQKLDGISFLNTKLDSYLHDCTPYVLILAPTAELVIQIIKVARSLLPHELACNCISLIGGTNFKRLREKISKNIHLFLSGHREGLLT